MQPSDCVAAYHRASGWQVGAAVARPLLSEEQEMGVSMNWRSYVGVLF